MAENDIEMKLKLFIDAGSSNEEIDRRSCYLLKCAADYDEAHDLDFFMIES